MSDVVAVMNQGRIVQEASPIEIYRAPKERFVANFVGLTNFLDGHILSPPNASGLGVVETATGALSCCVPAGAKVKDAVTVVIRPEDIVLNTRDSADRDQNCLEGKVVGASFLGEAMEYQIELAGGTRIRLKLHSSNAVNRGETIRMQVLPEQCRALLS
jgi:iron(III) transport system ATP-binding protein